MTKPILSAAKTFMKNILRHTERVVHHDESAKDAFKAINRDAKRLKNMATDDGHTRKDHKSALKLVEQGRRAYNNKDYTIAEDYFFRAIDLNPKLSLAYTYLGHTLYQVGRHSEAVAHWKRAVAVDPNSEGAVKARQKLQMIEDKAKRVAEDLSR